MVHPVRLGLALLAIGSVASAAGGLRVRPERVELSNPESSQQLLVDGRRDGRRVDLTRAVTYEVADRRVVAVSRRGMVMPRGEGSTEIVVRGVGATVRVPVRVTRLTDPAPVSFRDEVIPILTKTGCNSGGCHGKAEGQNGFKLSVFGFDPEGDHAALVKEKRGGRVSPAMPGSSLLLTKGTGRSPHGGGRKLRHRGPRYRRLLRWIAERARLDAAARPVVAIRVEPRYCTVPGDETQQLQVTAVDKTGASWCVTAEAEFGSNAEMIADVDRLGVVSATDVPGQAAIMVRYMGHVDVCRITRPQPGITVNRPPAANFIDTLVWDKLQELGIPASPICDDATFLRRAALDVTGTLPTAADTRAFLADKTADKRQRLVANLLERDAYADYWTMRWSDILRVDNARIKAQGSVAMTRWLRRQLAANTPYDRFVREILTVRGNTRSTSPAAFYEVLKTPEELGRSVSQLFLGVRIECAQCHHHPSGRWTQRDYFAFAGFFTGVGRKSVPGGGQKIFDQPGKDLKHPRSGELVAASGLGAAPAELSDPVARRAALADWVTSTENRLFARTIANRLWAHYFGRGLVEPIDDHRATNPASNEKLLEALTAFLVEVEFDLKAFTRTLLTSRTYQLDSTSLPDNELDSQNHSHASRKALPAEVLLDAICQATGVPERFNGWPVGYRAIQVWNNRLPSYFFRIFGRPMRVSVCECERGNEPSIAQALHLMNSPESVKKIGHRDGRAARLAGSKRPDPAIIDELYLVTLSRFPTAAERRLMLEAFAASPDNRRDAVEDILWTLLNSKEFLYNH